MTTSTPMLIMASGLWIVLLLGCGAFAIFALRQKRRAEIAEQKLSEIGLSTTVQSAASEPSAAHSEAQAQATMQLQALRAELDTTKLAYEESLQRFDATREELKELEASNAQQQGTITALEAERDILDRQMKNLSAGLAAGDSDTMREMIVNFTEESRELLTAIEAMGKEKAELQQRIADMESEGKGTAGTVVGLQRKLAEAEGKIQQLAQGSK